MKEFIEYLDTEYKRLIEPGIRARANIVDISDLYLDALIEYSTFEFYTPDPGSVKELIARAIGKVLYNCGPQLIERQRFELDIIWDKYSRTNLYHLVGTYGRR